MENRTFTRVDFSGRVSIHFGEELLWGDVKNMSLQGLRIDTTHEIPLHLPLKITIHRYPLSSIQLHACAVHSRKNGFGMKIHKLDVKSFVRLRETVASKCTDEAQLVNETLKVLHTII